MFLIASTIYVLGAVVYLILGNGETQYWAVRESSLAASARFTSTLLDSERRENVNYDTSSIARIISDDKVSEIGDAKRHE